MENITLKINGRSIEAQPGKTILQVARENGIHIPTLCYLKDINQSGSCRVCLVEVKNARTLLSACTTPIQANMEVFTNTPRVLKGRRNSVELLVSNHNMHCLSCIRNQTCELQRLCQELNVRDDYYAGELTTPSYDRFSQAIRRDTSKCILCARCIETCKKIQGIGILGFENRGFKTIVSPIYELTFEDVNCMQCGQCVINCPTGCLSENEQIQQVIDVLNDPNKVVVVQTAPAVRASLGEEFGLPIGTRVTGKMAAALRRCGFDYVYDTNFGADLTIMEEGHELLERIQHQGTLPMLTSCSPGWVRYMEFEYPDLLGHLSSSKSPHMMFGATIKSYWANKNNIDPKNIVVVSIMPCTAKKVEINKPENQHDDLKDVDYVLTTREVGRLIKLFGIDFASLPDEEFDPTEFGKTTGAGVIFGATGGVMEAALRTVKQQIEGKTLEKIDFMECRGLEGIKEACIELKGQPIWIAIASSMSKAKILLDQIQQKTSKYTFIEIMGCPGGCINGGGQSIISSHIKNGPQGNQYLQKRMQALYDEDEQSTIRISSDNPQIQQLYQEFFSHPGSHLAEKLLHTTYSPKQRIHFHQS